MRVTNPEKIKQADIVVGIPSYNEEETIGFVAEQASRGLEKYFPHQTKVIINVDNNSIDSTKDAFFSAEGKTPKIYISTEPDKKGKGYNFYNLFLMVKQLNSKATVVLDADLRSVRDKWIKRMVEPIYQGYHFVTPYYIRCKTDATITNHLVYPLVYGVLGKDLRQPIGGDFAFDAQLANYWLKKKWDQEIYQYGVDIFMTLYAIFGGFNLCQVNLGAKLHNLSTPKLGPMFYQVTNTLFGLLWQNKDKIKKDCPIEKIELLGGTSLPILANANPDKEAFQKIFEQGLKKYWPQIKVFASPEVVKSLTDLRNKEINKINLDLWTKIVYDFLLAYQKDENKEAVINSLGCLYFGRTVSFFKNKLTPEEAEARVRRRAKMFYNRRNYFIRQIQ